MQSVQRFASLIQLRPEFEERYIILHKHTFPGVLQRIRESNIRNYSIFLREGRLFTYYEYIGQNYVEDMRQMGKDTVTQEWWKLTDPMQEPLISRKEGEWWASMDEVYYFLEKEIPAAKTRRLAYVAEKGSVRASGMDIPESLLMACGFQKFAVFHKDEHHYLYGEYKQRSASIEIGEKKDTTTALLSQISFEGKHYKWRCMKEVFHTD